MSTGEARKVSIQDIQLVQDLIERCLQLYMSQKEVVNNLLHHAKIEPDFTELVWHKLKAENQEFFEAYNLRLLVKDHILQFNDLLAKQVELIHQICPSNLVEVPTGNINISENMLLGQRSNDDWTQGMNGEIIESQGGRPGDSLFMFSTKRNLQETPFTSIDLVSQPINEFILDPEVNSFGFLRQSPRNFSLSDFTTDFSGSTDVLESYSRSPILGTETSFVDPRFLGEYQDIGRLESLSESLRYEDFGSD